MQPETETDHMALLALTMVGILAQRLNELKQLDESTLRRLDQLVLGVRKHAEARGLTDLHVLFDNIAKATKH